MIRQAASLLLPRVTGERSETGDFFLLQEGQEFRSFFFEKNSPELLALL
jgi:hypothetical protein